MSSFLGTQLRKIQGSNVFNFAVAGLWVNTNQCSTAEKRMRPKSIFRSIRVKLVTATTHNGHMNQLSSSQIKRKRVDREKVVVTCELVNGSSCTHLPNPVQSNSFLVRRRHQHTSCCCERGPTLRNKSSTACGFSSQLKRRNNMRWSDTLFLE